jgi:toxin ParE1/3/4
MSHICRFTVPASRDIESIIDYVADRSSFDLAERLLDKINDKCKRLTSFPGMGKKRDELSPNVRSFPVDNYLVFYRLIEDDIEILRVVSGYRDLRDLFLIEDEE